MLGSKWVFRSDENISRHLLIAEFYYGSIRHTGFSGKMDNILIILQCTCTLLNE